MSKKKNKNILVIEKSNTFSQLLRQTLQAGGFQSIRTIPGFPSLPKSSQAFNKVDTLVVGSNSSNKSSLAHFLAELAKSHADLPVFVITDNKEALSSETTSKSITLLGWSEFSSLPGAIKKNLKRARNDQKESTTPVRILFVDDSYSVRFAYQKLLQDNGYLVTVAKNALEALKLARKNSFDLAIVDYYLPDTNGDKLCALLKQLDTQRHMQIALLTAIYQDEVIKSALEAGAIECMFKNEAKELFLARIASLARHVAAQKGLMESKQELLHVLQSVHDVILGINPDNRIVFFNKHAKKVTGKQVRLLGSPLNKVLSFYEKEPASSHLRQLNGTSLTTLMAKENLVCDFLSDTETLYDCNVTRIDNNNEQVKYLVILR